MLDKEILGDSVLNTSSVVVLLAFGWDPLKRGRVSYTVLYNFASAQKPSLPSIYLYF